MMVCKGLNRSGLTALLIAFSGFLFGQGVVDHTIETGFVKTLLYPNLELYHDSLLITTSLYKQNDTIKTQISVFQADDLSLRNHFFLKDKHQNTSTSCFTQDIGNGYFFSNEYTGSTTKLTLYKLDSNLRSVSKVFQKTGKEGYRIATVGIFDNEIFEMAGTGQSSIDTTTLSVYNLQGQLLRTVKDWVTGPSHDFDSTINTNYLFGPYQHPFHPESILYGAWGGCRIMEIDKQTLKIKYTMPRETPNLSFFGEYMSGFHFYTDKITCGGSALYLVNPQSSIIQRQSFLQSRAWNGDTLEKRKFGNVSVKEDCYSFDSYHNSQTHLLAAAAPFNYPAFEAKEFRKMIIHRYSQFGEDSLVLYGNKNHVAVRMVHNTIGDLFILSLFTDSWTTDSSYIQLTKIPGFAISLIEQKKVSSQIQLYPNPTSDYIRIDQLMEKPSKVAVYDQQGHLQLQTDVFEDKISIQQFPKGMYLVIVTTDDGKSYTTIVMKE